jgi:ankyrin repeat protein
MASARKDAALLAAVNAGDVARVVALLEQGASPLARNRNGWSALHLAAHSGSQVVTGLLLDGGADVDEIAVTDELIDRTRYEGSATPLLIALRHGHEPCALLLLKRGANVEHRDTFCGENALYLAAKHGFASVVEHVLARGPAGNCKVFGEETPLDAAARGGHIGIVRHLLAAGLPITARSLAEARRGGHLELAALLVDAGGI